MNDEKNIISLWIDNHYEQLKETFIELHEEEFNDYIHKQYQNYCKEQLNIAKKNMNKTVTKK